MQLNRGVLYDYLLTKYNEYAYLYKVAIAHNRKADASRYHAKKEEYVKILEELNAGSFDV